VKIRVKVQATGIRGGRNEERRKHYKCRQKGETNRYNIELDWNSPRPPGIDIEKLFKIYNLRDKDVQVLVLQKYVWQNHT